MQISMHSQISAFVVHHLNRTTDISKISRLKLVSVAEQAGLSLTWSQTHGDRFSCEVAYMIENDNSKLYVIPEKGPWLTAWTQIRPHRMQSSSTEFVLNFYIL